MQLYFEIMDLSPALTRHAGPVSAGSVKLSGAHSSHWKIGDDWLQQEILTTLTGTVYCIQAQISSPLTVHVKVNNPFIQLFYIIKAQSGILLKQHGQQQQYFMQPERAVYMYAPPADYTVHLESGSYLVYGFCFEPEILFGQHADIHPFFQPVLKARRAVYQHLVTSMDFRAEKNTRDKILELQQKLSLGKESSAFSILMTLKDLFALSIRKIQIEYEHHQASRLLVDLARSRIEQHYRDSDTGISIDSIADALCLPRSRLNKLHRLHYGYTISHYSKQCRLAKAKALLKLGEKIIAVALLCSFRDETSFHKYFLRETGMTPDAYRKSLL